MKDKYSELITEQKFSADFQYLSIIIINDFSENNKQQLLLESIKRWRVSALGVWNYTDFLSLRMGNFKNQLIHNKYKRCL